MQQSANPYGYDLQYERQLYGYAKGGSVGAVGRALNAAQHADVADTLGRADLQILQSTIVTDLPNIAGNPADQVSAVAFGSTEYSQTDVLPNPAMSRFNRFSSFDLRGDPITPDENGTARDASTLAAIRFGGSDEFLRKVVSDAVAPIPSVVGSYYGDRTYCDPSAQGRMMCSF
jgi:hypothetical protein